ncbi:hypothetical protein JCM10914A_28530 [Paenibacillus sp. JCM 10914]|uniref:hypothetical protein n=1 Tax=Paenibacillus sp. JCM 10914 TaxID=1236974 RepID=UPI0003CC6087|nr:hypothetical protein [Paenibacillus sp. JCM 10914]GAE08394.1 hypothetical protein JCM10914_4685 [Paenibacillus sp. JCM 10914]
MKIERTFIGTVKLEDMLIALLRNQIDSLISTMYDEKRVNAIPSISEGAAKQ